MLVEKSSVLEALSGIQLPRAQNICTRCPFRITLSDSNAREYATVHRIGQDKIELTDFNDINKYVIILTDELTGTAFNVVSTPIILEVFKHDVHDLTLQLVQT
ncbi:unnamed protein product [Didymodactylos carnosus]|uniref:Dynamin N-terminal domain-containing protein n=1 Tax=Didymodactylos carnosus TaxID=1234261 RepID=A0A816CLN0_9BILA|nr:unnamed protein product [Didymodactylos carnosus]CAF4516971.1 unnamed protein product [Didymodactylos carnosus]